jgi:hypothetical protein
MRVETLNKTMFSILAYLIKKNNKEGGGNGAEKTKTVYRECEKSIHMKNIWST